MEFTLTIKMDNAAFETVDGAEVARILHRLAERVEHTAFDDGDGEYIHDVNGNRVGHWEVSES